MIVTDMLTQLGVMAETLPLASDRAVALWAFETITEIKMKNQGGKQDAPGN